MLTRKTDSKAVNYGVATWFNYTELCLSALLPRSLGKFRGTFTANLFSRGRSVLNIEPVLEFSALALDVIKYLCPGQSAVSSGRSLPTCGWEARIDG